MASTIKQPVYARGSYLPFEEDATHEFKGHREIAPEDTPPWAFRNPSERQTRQAISRNLNAFLNSPAGGVVYCGVDDRGRVLGMHLTRYQKDHVLLSVRSSLLRYRPAVPSNRYRVTFVPVVSAADVHNPPTEFAYDVSRRSKQHLIFTSNYCWCDADARARSVSGVIPLSYVIEISILPWADRDATLQPYYLTESGKCYVRRQASVLPLTAADCIRITRHEAAALSRRQSEQAALASQRVVAELTTRLDAGQLLAPPSRSDCRCSGEPVTPRTPVGKAGEAALSRSSERDGGQRSTDRPESEEAAAAAGEALPRVLCQDSADVREERGGRASGRDLTESCDTDTGPAQSSGELSSSRVRTLSGPSSSTELTLSSRKLVHSSSSDSGLSLSSSSETGLSIKQFSSTDSGSTRQPSIDLSKAASSSSDSEIPPCRHHSVSTPGHASGADPVTSELTQSTSIASGIPAVCERLQNVLSANVCVPLAEQSPVGGTAAAAASAATADGVTASGSDLLPPGGADTALDGGESDVSLSASAPAGDVSLFDLGESGCSEMSLPGLEEAPDRPLMELGTRGSDLDGSEADLGAGEADLGAGEADLGAGEADLCVMEAGMARISGTDSSLLDLESAPEPPTSRRDVSSSAVAAPTPALPSLRLSVTSSSGLSMITESDSALTTEAESDLSQTGEECLSAVSDPALDSVRTYRARHSGAMRRGGSGPGRSPTQVVPAGVWTLPRGFRGRGRALTTDEKDPEAVGMSPEAVGKAAEAEKGPGGMGNYSDPVGKVLEAVGKREILRLGSEPAEEFELDSDDSECSWSAGFRPERSLVAGLTDRPTAV